MHLRKASGLAYTCMHLRKASGLAYTCMHTYIYMHAPEEGIRSWARECWSKNQQAIETQGVVQVCT
tara:strand:+ start:177 stop:374 length:198 start_codon:yes stop_codon:yes gene_type:complete